MSVRLLQLRMPLRPSSIPGLASNSELLRLGMVAKYMCSQMTNVNDPQRLKHMARLEDVRREWDRRFPSVPLSATFYRDED
jgi:hypothetical protein